MSDHGNPPSDPYGQNPYGQNPYGQEPGQPGQQPGGYGTPLGVPAAYASWVQRVGAFLIDQVIGLAALIPYYIGAVMAAGSLETTTDPVTGELTTSPGGASGIALLMMLLGVLLYVAYFVWNICLKQGRTGYSIGKGVVGIKLIKLDSGQPMGAGLSFVRQIAHIVDGLPCYIGYLWPLWDAKRQTFADKIMGSVVIQQPKG